MSDREIMEAKGFGRVYTPEPKKQELPDARKHQIISFVKSGIRIVSCIAGLCGYFGIGFFGLLLAEIVGIYEELV